nr:ribonuclease H-like domain-containing protein [Tanacetum cinerariifolium]
MSSDFKYGVLQFERDVKGHFVRDYRAKGNQKSKTRDVGCNGNKTRDNSRRPAYQDDSKALVTIDGEDIDWFGHIEEDAQNYAMMAYSSSNSGYEIKASDLEDTSVNDRYTNGMHVVPPPMTGNYMPSRPDVEIDYSKVTYGPKQTSVDESDSKPSTSNHSPKIEKQDRNGDTKKGLGYAFTRKACFVCGNFSHLITDCDFKEKRMAKQAKLTKSKNKDDPHNVLKDKGIVDSGCSRHMTGNKAHLADYQEFKGGSVAFEGSNERITGNEKIKAGKLDFKDEYYVEELKHYNLFSVSQMCDKKDKVLFTDTNCLVMSPDFNLPDENQVLLKIPRQHNMYSFNLKNIGPFGDLACLFAKASIDESNKWHRMLGHVNFKKLNKLVKGNLVRDLPLKIFENDHTCVAC